MSQCPYAVSGDDADVPLPWWEELCLKYGVDPTPPPTFPPPPIEFPGWLADRAEAALEEVAADVLRPALADAGVENPEDYSLTWDPVVPSPAPPPPPAPKPPVATYDERPPRRPWVSVEAFSDTQTMPIVKDV